MPRLSDAHGAAVLRRFLRVRGRRDVTAAALACVLVVASTTPLFSQLPLLGPLPISSGGSSGELQLLAKLDAVLQERASLLTGRSRIIVRAVDTGSLGSVILLIQQLGGTLGRTLLIISGQVADFPNASLLELAGSPLVAGVSLDRLMVGALERTRATIRATEVSNDFGYDGAGIGVAIIDSGITDWHDDLTDSGAAGSQRISRFRDFVNGGSSPYDDYGHGTHVAGVIAGNGFDSAGARSGVAPRSHLVVVKVLDGHGRGRISDVIAGFNYILARKDELAIRIVNLSIAAAVYESYNRDPLTLAARRVVASGIVVVAAAGNLGRNQQGRTQYGGITSPGNAPWVLTAGASSHGGTFDRGDDTIAAFSSRGPTAVDFSAKPDLVAPGVGIESLSDPDSAFYASKSQYLLSGTEPTSYLPYLSLSGTSMAAPVISGTVALMLQANPQLTPNAVKAILQYTAQRYPPYDALTQGAGFLDAAAAVKLARFFAAPSENSYPSDPTMSAELIWGNKRFTRGLLMPNANAWPLDVQWGASATRDGSDIAWGVICSDGTCDASGGEWVTWGTNCSDGGCGAGASGNGMGENVVWGSKCGGADCSNTTWSASDMDTVVWGTTDADTVVWGTDDVDTVVWGTTCNDASCYQSW